MNEAVWADRQTKCSHPRKEMPATQQPKEKDARIEITSQSWGNTQISRNGLIYKRELASNCLSHWPNNYI